MHTIITTQTLGVECGFSVAEMSKCQSEVKMTEASVVYEEECIDEDPHQPMCSRSISTRRKVQFNEVVNVRRIDFAASEYSRQEMEDCWFTRFEYQQMRHEMRHTVKVIERGDHFYDTDKHCARGLESMSLIKAKDKRRTKDIVILSVLIEQAQQDENNVYNPGALANVSMRCSSISRSRAESRGIMDAIEACKLYSSDHSHNGTKSVSKKKIMVHHLKAALISNLRICNVLH